MHKIILITRPLHQASALYEGICRMGDEALLFPTIEISPPDDFHSLYEAIQSLEKFEIAIFTSANAVIHTFPFLPKKLPRNLPANLKVASIGPATTRALEERGIKVAFTSPPPFSTESLLSLKEFQKLANKKIVIFTGMNGRELLQTMLKSRGASVQVAMSYKRILPSVSGLADMLEKCENVDIITGTSLESLKNLLLLLGSKKNLLFQKPIIVVSERLVKLAKTLGFKKIILTKNASDQAILEAITDYKKEI